MTTWSAGYVAEIDYTYGYFRDLSPGILSLAATEQRVATNLGNAGKAADLGRPLRYLELGFGQGLSLAIHAAACDGEFWGTDFHPGQAAHAKELVRAFGGNVHVFDQSFTEFAAREDLPEFDVITLHGIWSWISPDNRAAIVDVVRRRLATGGVLYLSYNCLPGTAPVQPLRHLMNLQETLAGRRDAGITDRVHDAMAFAQQVIDSGAHYFGLNPIVAERFQVIKTYEPTYLAHEYFGEHWELMHFSQVSELLQAAKLDFATSTNMLDHIPGFNLRPEWQAMLETIGNPVLRETVRDFMLNTQFRADVFVKGRREMAPIERTKAMQATAFMLTMRPQDVPMTATGPIGVLSFDQTLYEPLLGAMAAQEYAPKTLQALMASPGLQARPVESVIQALLVLIGENRVQPAQSAEATARAAPRCQALNLRIFEGARHANRINFVASPVLGAGFMTRRIELLFLLARQEGKAVAAWPQFVYQTLVASGTGVLKDGKFLDTAAEGMEELGRQAGVFVERRLPIFQALGVD